MWNETINQLIKKNNLSNLKVAKAINVSSTAIHKWRNGLSEPTLTNICQLCDYFEVTPNYLLGYTDNPKG